MPSTVEVYEKLKPKLGEEETQFLLAYMEQSLRQDVATKSDFQQLKVDLQQLKVDLQQLKVDLQQLEQRLDSKIDNRFFWLLGIMLTTWFATFMAILMKFPGT